MSATAEASQMSASARPRAVPTGGARPRWPAFSLRSRLAAGAGVIALVAIGAAGLTAWGAAVTRAQVDAASAAQARMETLGTLSARVNDYAIVAIEAVGAPASERQDRIASRAAVVSGVFERAQAELAAAVNEAEDLPEIEQMARATRSLGLARMAAEFDHLHRRLGVPGRDATPAELRSELDAFATRFSPLLDRQIVEERRARDAAFVATRTLAERLGVWAVGLILATLAALAVFQAGLVRPLFSRITRFGAAASAIGGGVRGTRLPVARHDELGLVSAQINRMAARLDRRAAEVTADRAALERTILERTEALREANRRLERIDRSRRRFFADIGHELRTPLTVIKGEADLALDGPAPDREETLQSFGVIRARAARLHRRIDDLLRVARSEDGNIELDERPFDLRGAVRDALDDLRPLAERRRQTLAGPGRDVGVALTVEGDADWTRQVIAGLIDNALRLSPEGARVGVDVARRDGTAVVEVADEGPGVVPDRQAEIFERFTRGPSAGAGFGIGLALARWVVERQGGRVTLESPAPRPVSDEPLGPGAVFRVTLPLTDRP